MSRYCWRSTLSKEELFLWQMGDEIHGESNLLTDLIKMIGKYEILSCQGLGEKIQAYCPEEDNTYQAENRGYSRVAQKVKSGYPMYKRGVSRKYIKALSRKWKYSRVLVTFECTNIISVVLDLLRSNEHTQAALAKYVERLDRKGVHLNDITLFPIQRKFLCIRVQNHGKNWREANEVINNQSKRWGRGLI